MNTFASSAPAASIRSLRPAVLTCAVLLLVGTLEVLLFGSDDPGTAHDISVVSWMVSVVAFVGLLALGVTALLRRRRA